MGRAAHLRWAVWGLALMCGAAAAQASEAEAPPVQVGHPAPAFALPDQSGATHQLADYRGRWVLVYFYPKDDTPGCTKEACALRDRFGEFVARKVAVLGISADSVESHKQFAGKFQLPFPLLADTDKQVVQAYGVWGERQMQGKASMGIRRTSFLIDPQGTVAKIYPNVNPEEHAQEILRDLTQLGAQEVVD